MEELVVVLIVGAGPAGLAAAACLRQRAIPYLIIEREDCSASLWRNRTYDRLKLHLAKEFCALPYMPYPPNTATYVPRVEFIEYLDRYMEHFDIRPRFCTSVESATYDAPSKRWAVAARDTVSGAEIRYAAKYLVAATGENGVGRIPVIPGLESFPGEAIHSSLYKTGRGHAGQKVLVVGSGNSGMEIAYDLANHGADTSIIIRSPVHIVTKESLRMGMNLVKYLPVNIVDRLIVMKDNLIFGDLSRHGIVRPKMGPLLLKAKTSRSSVIDVGTVELIKKDVIKVFRGVSKIDGNKVTFEGGKERSIDAIVFATGYKSTASNWLKDNNKHMLNDDGFPKKSYPDHWKGEDGLYFAGFARRGLAGIAMDAKNIASDIASLADLVCV